MISTNLQNLREWVSKGAMAAAVSLSLVGSMAASAQTATLGLDINDDAVRLSWQQSPSTRQIAFGASAFNHQDRGTVITGDFHIIGNAATKARPVAAGLGGRVVYANTDLDNLPTIAIVPPPSSPTEDGYALSIGGYFSGQLPNYDRIGYGGHLYFSPDVLAFGDLEEFADLWLYGSYSVLRNGDVYIGARTLKGDFKLRGDFNFDTGVHIGFRLKF
ncbi:MAG: YfaZ family outer membrane protein [Pseudomonadota bacterium]